MIISWKYVKLSIWGDNFKYIFFRRTVDKGFRKHENQYWGKRQYIRRTERDEIRYFIQIQIKVQHYLNRLDLNIYSSQWE